MSWTADDVPLGEVTRPHIDLDQGWRILIWRHADRVYIAAGEDASLFHGLRWVRADEHISAWAGARARAHDAVLTIVLRPEDGLIAFLRRHA